MPKTKHVITITVKEMAKLTRYLEKIRAAFDEVAEILSDNFPDAYIPEDQKYVRECFERTDRAECNFNDAYEKLAELLNAAAERGH